MFNLRTVEARAMVLALASLLTATTSGAQDSRTVRDGAPCTRPTFALEGLVVLPDGSPAAGALVEVVRVEPSGKPSGDARTTLADRRGRFRIESLRGGEHQWTAVAPFGAPTYGEVFLGDVAETFAVLQLLRPLVCGGVVVDAGGTPIPNATVEVDVEPHAPGALRTANPPGMWWFLSAAMNERAFTARTDERGRFLLPSIRPFDWANPGLVVRKDGYAPHRLPVVYGPAATTLRVVLEPAAAKGAAPRERIAAPTREVRFVLRTPKGPPSFAEILLNHDRTRHGHVAEPDGTCVVKVDEATADRFSVYVLGPGFRDVLQREVVPDAAGRVAIDLQELPVVRIRAVADENGDVLTDARVTNARAWSDGRLPALVRRRTVPRVVDEDDWEHDLVCECAGRLPVAIKPPLAARTGDEADLEVRLRRSWIPDARIDGQVVDEAGRPISGAHVRRSASDIPSAACVEGRPREERTRTGVDGGFSFDGAYAGRHRFRVTAAGFAPYDCDTTELSPFVGVVLSKGFALSGRVVDDAGAPLGGVTVEAEWVFGADRDRGDWAAPRGFADWTEVVTASDGSFCFDGLPTARVLLSATAADHAFPSQSDCIPRVTDVVDGPVTIVGNRLRTVWVAAVDAAGRPLTDAQDRLSVDRRSSSVANVDAPSFDALGRAACVLEPGPFLLAVERRDGSGRKTAATFVTERDVAPAAGPQGAEIAYATFGFRTTAVFVPPPSGRTEAVVATLRRVGDPRAGWSVRLGFDVATTCSVPLGEYDVYVGADVERDLDDVRLLHRTEFVGRFKIGADGAEIPLPANPRSGVVRVTATAADGSEVGDVVATVQREDGAPLALMAQQDSAPELPAFEVRVPLAATNERAMSAALRLVPGRVRIVLSDRSGRTVERTVNVVGDTVVAVAAEFSR